MVGREKVFFSPSLDGKSQGVFHSKRRLDVSHNAWYPVLTMSQNLMLSHVFSAHCSHVYAKRTYLFRFFRKNFHAYKWEISKKFMLCYFTMWGKWDFPKVGTRVKRKFRTISCKAHLHIIAAVLC